MSAERARTLVNLAELFLSAERPAKALSPCNEAIRIRDVRLEEIKKLGSIEIGAGGKMKLTGPSAAADLADREAACQTRVSALMAIGAYDEAEMELMPMVEGHGEQHAGDAMEGTRPPAHHAIPLLLLARLRRRFGDYRGAFRRLGEARHVVSLRSSEGAMTDVATTMLEESVYLRECCRFEEAEKAAKEGLAIRKDLLGENHPGYPLALFRVADQIGPHPLIAHDL